MDSFQSQSKKHRIYAQSLAAQLYDLEKRIDDIFRRMALEIASLYFDKHITVNQSELQPFYDELAELQQDIQEVKSQQSGGIEPPAFPLAPSLIVSQPMQDNYTFTSTATPAAPRTIKLKVRVLDEAIAPGLQTSSLSTTSDEAILEPDALLQSMQGLHRSDEDATLDHVQKEHQIRLTIKPKKRF